MALVGLFLAYSACSQGNGERCQQNSDCASGYCANPGNPQTAQGGFCCASATTCAGMGGTSDGAIDGGVMEAGLDGPDNSAVDAPMESLAVDAASESLPVDGSAAETSDDTMPANDAAPADAPALDGASQ